MDLVRETADGLGRLMIQHLKLAQIELTANIRALGSRAVLVVVCAVLIIVGYTLTMMGVAILVGGGRAWGVPLVGIGVGHIIGAGIGMLIVLARLRRTPVMKNTADVIGQSATALIAPIAAPSAHIAPAAVAPASAAISAPPPPTRLEDARARR